MFQTLDETKVTICMGGGQSKFQETCFSAQQKNLLKKLLLRNVESNVTQVLFSAATVDMYAVVHFSSVMHGIPVNRMKARNPCIDKNCLNSWKSSQIVSGWKTYRRQKAGAMTGEKFEHRPHLVLKVMKCSAHFAQRYGRSNFALFAQNRQTVQIEQSCVFL